jgi:hypothetical protein
MPSESANSFASSVVTARFACCHDSTCIIVGSGSNSNKHKLVSQMSVLSSSLLWLAWLAATCKGMRLDCMR